MTPAETISGIGGGKGEWWSGWIQLWYIVRTFVNAQCAPSTIIKYNKKLEKIDNVKVIGIP
jgi:hypothetical protein